MPKQTVVIGPALRYEVHEDGTVSAVRGGGHPPYVPFEVEAALVRRIAELEAEGRRKSDAGVNPYAKNP